MTSSVQGTLEVVTEGEMLVIRLRRWPDHNRVAVPLRWQAALVLTVRNACKDGAREASYIAAGSEHGYGEQRTVTPGCTIKVRRFRSAEFDRGLEVEAVSDNGSNLGALRASETELLGLLPQIEALATPASAPVQ